MSYVLVQVKSEAAVAGIKQQVAKLGYVALPRMNSTNASRLLTYNRYRDQHPVDDVISFIVGLSISGRPFTRHPRKPEKFGALKAIGAKGRELIYMILFMRPLRR